MLGFAAEQQVQVSKAFEVQLGQLQEQSWLAHSGFRDPRLLGFHPRGRQNEHVVTVVCPLCFWSDSRHQPYHRGLLFQAREQPREGAPLHSNDGRWKLVICYSSGVACEPCVTSSTVVEFGPLQIMSADQVTNVTVIKLTKGLGNEEEKQYTTKTYNHRDNPKDPAPTKRFYNGSTN